MQSAAPCSFAFLNIVESSDPVKTTIGTDDPTCFFRSEQINHLVLVTQYQAESYQAILYLELIASLR